MIANQSYSECRRRWGQVELHRFDPESERTLHRLHRELRKAQHRNLEIMQNNEEQDPGHEQNELQGGRNGTNGKNQAHRSFIQQDNPFMLLEEFAYHIQLFRRLSEDHLFKQTTSS